MASSEVSKGYKMNFKIFLETILSDAEKENLAQLSNGAEHFFESDYSDEEENNDLEGDDEDISEEVPFRPIMPLTEVQKKKVALRDRLCELEVGGKYSSEEFYPLQLMAGYLSHTKTFVFESNGKTLVDENYILEKIQKKDISNLSIELVELLNESENYLERCLSEKFKKDE